MIKVIGIGAAGNKSMISVMESGIVSTENVMLINSTDADVPVEYKSRMSLLSDKAYGCAKEAQTAETLCIDALDKDTLPIRQFIGAIDESTEVILVASTDGGTGCGATPVLADWITNEIGCALRIIPLVGFGIDETGLRNTVSFFTKLSPDYIVEPICNEKFLSLANNNHRKAEELANIELAQRLSILTGKIIVESSQNIDKADLLKTIKKSGFATTEYAEFSSRLKNVDDFNKLVNKMLDESKSFDITKPSQKRMAVILNLNSTSTDCIDWNFSVLKERLGYVKEVYLHVQNTDTEEFIAVISSGSLIPKDAIDDIYKKYTDVKNRISKEKEEFYNDNRYDLDDDGDSVYNKRNTSSGSRFFNKSKFGQSSASVQAAATSEKSMKEF